MKRTNSHLTSNARNLRSEMTDAELKLWQQLRMRQIHGLKFRRQYPCGYYILDFACLELKLAIELDGGQHADQAQEDSERTRWLESQGWQVLRFWNNDVFEHVEAVLAVIVEHCHPHPSLPPKMGKGF